jgi:hypothetical protein
MKMVGHEAVRNGFKPVIVSGTQQLITCGVGCVAIHKDAPPVRRANGEEIRVQADVVERW